MPTLTILNGFIASGKTTYAKQLQAKATPNQLIRFSTDDWMLPLFNDIEIERQAFDARIDFLEQRFQQLAETFLANGVDVILDFGGWSQQQRQQSRQWAQTLNCTLNMVYFDIDLATCQQRAVKRTNNKEANSYDFDADCVKELYALYEPAADNETFDLVISV